MNYFDNLPQDIINIIENKVEELYLDEWKIKMNLVNNVFRFACDIDDITECVEEGMTYREINEEILGEEGGKLSFRGMECMYYKEYQYHLKTY